MYFLSLVVYLLGTVLSKHCREKESESEVTHLCDPWTVAYQAPLSMGFSRQEYWSGLPSPYHHPSPERSSSQMKLHTYERLTTHSLLHQSLSTTILFSISVNLTI